MTDNFLITGIEHGEIRSALTDTYQDAAAYAHTWAESAYNDVTIWKRVATAKAVTTIEIEDRNHG